MRPLDVRASPVAMTDRGSGHLFSRYAPLYDAEERRNPVARWTRARNIAHLKAVFSPGAFLLEIGCGTGTEAMALARAGRSIIATDDAPGMIEQVRLKVAAESGADAIPRVQPILLPAARLHELTASYGHMGFDGVYSSFGPLNCEPDLPRVFDSIAALVRPGGMVVISLLGRYCLWETAWHLAHGDGHRAFRRWSGIAQGTVQAEWAADTIEVHYWSSAEINSIFERSFKLVERASLPWILPPQYLGGIFRGRSRLFKLLASVERITAQCFPANLVGDHIRYTFIRK